MTAYSQSKTYVALNSGASALRLVFEAFRHISGEDTYPRTCFIKHVLGFTHICGQGWENGKFFVLRKTTRKRLIAKLKQVKAALRVRMHQPLVEVGRWLRRIVQGYFNYHVVPGNLASLRTFRFEVRKRWLQVIRRRSQRSRNTWELFERIADQWLPVPTILHPYPLVRFDAKYLR